MECAGRQPGDRITEIIDQAYGIDFLQTLLDVYSGEVPQLPSIPQRGAAVEFLASDKPANGFTGVADAAALPGIISVEMEVGQGDPVMPLRSVSDRAGSVLAVATTAAEAERLALAACAAIHFTFDESDSK